MQDTENNTDTQHIPDNSELNQVINIMLEKKAQDILIFDLRSFTQLFDYAIITTGLSTTQLDVIARSIERGLRQSGIRPLGTEGTPECGWILLDYVDFVVHIFGVDQRKFYRLDKLWGDMPSTEIESTSFFVF